MTASFFWHVLHEEGAPAHYIGLVELARTQGATVQFHEFRCFKHAVKGLVRRDFGLFLRAICNAGWLLYALCGGVRQQVVIIGIAPFDWRLACLWPLLRRNKVFWHTSWPDWRGGFEGRQYPKSVRFPGQYQLWRKFIEHQLVGILFVTSTAQQSFLSNVNSCPSNVVWHAFDQTVFYPALRQPRRPLTLGYVGRLEPQKGIKQLLDMVNDLQGYNVRCLIVGSGTLQPQVERAAAAGQVDYRGILKGGELASAYREMDFLLLPSLRTLGWEEAFGMVIIEAMACGVIPLVTDHSGPLSILQEHFPQFIFSEANFHQAGLALIKKILANPVMLATWRCRAIDLAQSFTSAQIARRWAALIASDAPVNLRNH